MADSENIGWLRERLQASLALEAKDPSDLLDWLDARRKDVPFSAELIPVREVANWHQAENGNITARPVSSFASRVSEYEARPV
jgi:hypothetical protein